MGDVGAICRGGVSSKEELPSVQDFCRGFNDIAGKEIVDSGSTLKVKSVDAS